MYISPILFWILSGISLFIILGLGAAFACDWYWRAFCKIRNSISDFHTLCQYWRERRVYKGWKSQNEELNKYRDLARAGEYFARSILREAKKTNFPPSILVDAKGIVEHAEKIADLRIKRIKRGEPAFGMKENS